MSHRQLDGTIAPVKAGHGHGRYAIRNDGELYRDPIDQANANATLQHVLERN
jgi:hypothetical protein